MRYECPLNAIHSFSTVSIANANTGSTPLHFACIGGNLKVVQLLLKKGAAVEARNVLGLTPLHCASDMGFVEVARWLIAVRLR